MGQKISSLNEFVEFFFLSKSRIFLSKEKIAMEQAAACANYLSVSNNKDVTVLLDGLDEFPEELREKSFIADIINRRELASAAVVISSCSHACAHLRDNVSCRVDILGFTKEDQLDYINEALTRKGQGTSKVLQ